MDVRFKVPSNFYISGQSQCGKSYLVTRFENHTFLRITRFENHTFLRITWLFFTTIKSRLVFLTPSDIMAENTLGEWSDGDDD